MGMHTHARPGLMRRPAWCLAVVGVSLLLFLTACGSPTARGQTAQSEQARLDTAIQHVATIGVPASLLTPIRQQEARIAKNLSPLGLFGDHNSDAAYTNAIGSYQVLEGDVASAIAQATQAARFQAHQAIQAFDALLQQRQNQGFDHEVPGYQARLNQVQQGMPLGRRPMISIM